MFFVDEEFAEAVSKHSWVPVSDGRYLAASIKLGAKRRMVMLHRFVWLLKHGDCPPIIDHINRIRHDCRLENLRPADHSLSNRNRGHMRGEHPPGVVRMPHAKTRPWQAKVYTPARRHLGCYPTIEEASLAVANARLAMAP
jgi:hypothetical protein